MNNKSKVYTVFWVICIVLFNVIVFIVPIGRSQSFWIGYVFITLAFLGQLGCTFLAFKKENLEKIFYNIPLISISYTGLIIMLVVGAACMTISSIPNWLGTLICLLILGVTAIAVMSAGTAAHVVGGVDERVSAQSAFVKTLTVDAENLMHRAKAPMLKDLCKRVYEAARYSDPMSNKALFAVEQRIKEEFDVLTDAIITNDLDCTESTAKELLALLAERNNKCKALK